MALQVLPNGLVGKADLRARQRPPVFALRFDARTVRAELILTQPARAHAARALG